MENRLESEQNFNLNKNGKILTAAVIVAALGYFVDIFDLLLFSIVRKPSLASLGLNESQQVDLGLLLHNIQMIGMLIGGVIWGVLGDKKGRLSVLFGSIALYSVGNLANAFVQNVFQYGVCRLISGIGLAGELGAGITLVTETLPKEKRGYGTMIVATIGVSGAVVGGLVGEIFSWRTTYIIGALLGFLLLLLRINTAESLLFKNAVHDLKNADQLGKFSMIFKRKERFFRFFNSILIAVPIWYVVGTLIQLAPEFAKALGVQGDITAGRAVMICYSGLVFGDLTSGLLSQILKSRNRAVLIFQLFLLAAISAYFILGKGASSFLFYSICAVLGFFTGYWAVFVTIAAEQFGTNLRATVATSAPNFVRASVVPISIAFTLLRTKLGFDILTAAIIVGAVVMFLAVVANLLLKDTFHSDLDFFEVD
jgi:MFS family permease